MRRLEKENYIQNTPYDVLTGKKETEEVNEFIRQYIGANDNLKLNLSTDKNGKRTSYLMLQFDKSKGEFVSIKSPDEAVLDKDYLLVDYFTEASKITVRIAKGEPSLEEHFTKGTLIEKAVRALRRKSLEITDENLHDIIVSQSEGGDQRSREQAFNMKMSKIDGKEKSLSGKCGKYVCLCYDLEAAVSVAGRFIEFEDTGRSGRIRQSFNGGDYVECNVCWSRAEPAINARISKND